MMSNVSTLFDMSMACPLSQSLSLKWMVYGLLPLLLPLPLKWTASEREPLVENRVRVVNSLSAAVGRDGAMSQTDQPSVVADSKSHVPQEGFPSTGAQASAEPMQVLEQAPPLVHVGVAFGCLQSRHCEPQCATSVLE